MYFAPAHLGPWTALLIAGVYFIFCWFSQVGNHNRQEKLQKPRHASDKVLKSRNAQIFNGLGSGQ
jgi:hypothetical protein